MIRFNDQSWPRPTARELEMYRKGTQIPQLGAIAMYAKRHGWSAGPVRQLFEHLLTKEAS